MERFFMKLHVFTVAILKYSTKLSLNLREPTASLSFTLVAHWNCDEISYICGSHLEIFQNAKSRFGCMSLNFIKKGMNMNDYNTYKD